MSQPTSFMTTRSKLIRLGRSLSAVVGGMALLALVFLAAQVAASGTLIDPASDEPLLQVVGVLDGGALNRGGLGHAVASGDVNGDGYDDLLVSAPYADVISGSIPLTESGAVYLYLGYEGMTGTLYLSTTTPNLTFFSDCRGFVGCQDWAGKDLALGDMNGDGLDDIMIGVERYHGTPGAAFVFVGRKTLTSSTHVTLDIQTRAQFTEWGYSFGAVSAWAPDRLGTVASGDLNGDGYDDLIMGAYAAAPDAVTSTAYYYPDRQRYHLAADALTRTFAGLVYVSAGWGELTKTNAIQAYDYLKCLDSLTIYGEDTYDYFGRSVASGDVDGDGLDDIIVGADGGDRTTQGEFGDDSGQVYVFWGSDVITRVQVGDDTPDCRPGDDTFTVYTDQMVIDLAYTQTVQAYGITVGHNADVTIFGAYDASAAGFDVSSGDLNGDGYADVIIGAPGTSSQPGWVHVVYGGERASLASTILLSETADLTIVGEANDDGLGVSVNAADLNGDGLDDLIVGAIGADYSGRSEAGKTYVFYGTDGDALVGTIDLGAGNPAQLTFVGERASNGAGAGLGAGDLNHDGILDLLVGAPWFDMILGVDEDEGTLYAIAGDAARGITMTGALTTVGAGYPVTYTLSAWNQYGDWDASAASTFTLQTGAGGSCVGRVCSPTALGTWSVTGTFHAFSDVLTLTVEPGDPARVEISPTLVTLDPGDVQQFSARDYDAYDNLVSGSTYQWAVLDGDAGGIDGSGLFTASRTGTYPDAVRVTVSGYGSVSDTATVVVNNLTPTAVISGTPIVGYEGTPLTFDGSPSHDPAGDITAYAWDWDYGGSFVTEGTGVTDTTTYADDQLVTVALRVTDNSATTDLITTLVTIRNVSPTVQLGGPYNTSLTQTVTITSAVSDPGADALTYAWDLDDDGQFDDGSGTTAPFTPTADGLFTVTLRVADDDGGAGSGQTNVVVGNLPPTAVISDTPLAGLEGAPITFDGSQSLDVADTLVYAWDWDYDGAFGADVAGVTATHTWADDGSFVVALRVTDTHAASDLTTTTVTVGNVAPAVQLGGPYTTPLTGTVTLTSTVFDPGADALTYAWDLDDDGAFDDATTATAIFSPTATGTFTVWLRVQDGDGGQGLDQTTVTVMAVDYTVFLPVVLRNP